MQIAAMSSFRDPAGGREPARRGAPLPAYVLPARAPDETMDIKSLLDVLRRRFLTILGAAGLVLGAAIAYLAVATPLYTATNLLLLDPRDPRVLPVELSTAGVGSDVALVESQLRIILSDAVLLRVVDDLQLDKDPAYAGKLLAEKPGAAPEELRLAALGNLEHRVTASRADRTYIIEIKATAASAQRSAGIANAVAAAYLAEQADAVRGTKEEANTALSARLAVLRDDWRKAEADVAVYREQNNLVGERGTLVTDQQIAELNQRLIAARAEASAAAARAGAASRGGDGSIPAATNSPVVGGLRAQIADLRKRLSELTVNLGDNHPDVKRVRAQIANAEAEIGAEIGRIQGAARAEANAAAANVAALESQLADLTTRLQNADGTLIRLRELERDAVAAKELYEAFLASAKQTGQDARIDVTAARVISPAIPPDAASFPPRTLLLAAALVIGLGLGIAAALMAEHLDDRVRGAEQLRGYLNLPVLARVPQTEGRGKARKTSLLSRLWPGRRTGFDRFDFAIRSLYNELRMNSTAPAEASILFVSPNPAEGSTAIALSFALAAVASGERVLLVDADPARRGLTKLVAPAATTGLYDVIDGSVPLSQAVMGGPAAALQALPIVPAKAGKAARHPTRADFDRIIDSAVAAGIDLVIFDGAPILLDPDVRAVSEAAGQVALVVKSGTTQKAEIAEALRLLNLPAYKLRGTVLTGIGERA